MKIYENIKTESPTILSASRATDIPHYFSKDFFENWQRGFFWWKNPFNSKQISKVLTDRVRVVIFWSKFPLPIFDKLKFLDEIGVNYYFQFTLNDYEKEGIEMGIPPLEKRIETFIDLSEKIGKGRVVWRFDPLILLPGIGIEELINRIDSIGKRISNYTDRLTISFVDILNYGKVKKRLKRKFQNFDVGTFEIDDNKQKELAFELCKLCNMWKKENPNFQIFTCGESTKLEKYGIMKGKCIDDELMIREFSDDKELMKYFGVVEELSGRLVATKNLKHRGQRKRCNCVTSKDIGKYGSCKSECIYCYAKR
jgi:DNA repair photolyase